MMISVCALPGSAIATGQLVMRMDYKKWKSGR
ncbi:unnamed protein product, partial [marine sediment metagenome]